MTREAGGTQLLSPLRGFGRALRQSPGEARIGLFLVGAVMAVAFVGPFIAPHAPHAVGLTVPAAEPSLSFPFGGDQLGRDVLSRVLNGGRSVLIVPGSAVVIAFLCACGVGVAAAYFGGRFDSILDALTNVLLPIPPLLVALLVLTGGRQQPLLMIAVVAIVFFPRMFRVIRGSVRGIIRMEYVQAAEARGEPVRRIVAREVLPNAAGPVLVEFGIRLNFAVVFVASLNFLGFGRRPPSSDWSLMISESLRIMHLNPLAVLAPVALLSALVIGINFLTDAATQVINEDRV